MEVITSKSNEKVKYIKSLNDKKFREKYNSYFVEGIKVINEIMEQAIDDITFIACFLDNLKDSEIIEKIKQKNIPIIYLSKEIFEYITDTKSPQGILAVINKKEKYIDYNKDIIILDGVSDLGNLGTIIRNSVAFDINNIICINNVADIYSPKCVRSSMSNILKCNIKYEENIEDIFAKLKEKGYTIYGTDLLSDIYLKNQNFKNEKTAFVFGNESKGMSKEIKNKCDKLFKIEMEDNVESLNVASASSIILYKNYLKNFK